MDAPTMMLPYSIDPEIDVLPAYLPIPGLGMLAINSFLFRGEEPLLVDTGLVRIREAFMDALRARISVADLRWIWLSHVDLDHIGSLQALLEEAPRARVITTFLAMGKMSLARPLDPERAFLLNPGEQLVVGDRKLRALRPPTYDAPETTGFLDAKSGALFTSDSFGALLSEPAERAADISPEQLGDGLTRWTCVDSPWIHNTDPASLDASLRRIRELEPRWLLSSHLPAASGQTDALIGYLRAARTAAPFVGFNQEKLAAMLAAE